MKFLLLLFPVLILQCSSSYCIYTNGKGKFVKVFSDDLSACPKTTEMFGQVWKITTKDPNDQD